MRAIFDLDVWDDAATIHRRLAYVPSEANLWPSLTGAEVLEFLAAIHGSVDARYRDELVDRFELALDKKVRAYSHGNRQKVMLIAAFASRADVLLLDEPTTGLDPLMEQVFRTCVREARDRGQTVLLSSHILSEVEVVCDRVAMLRAGRIIEIGRLDDLRGLLAVRVHAQLDGPPPDLSGIAGVSNVVVDGNTIECDVTGSMEAFLRAVATVGVQQMTTREPSLEEVFVSHYGKRDAEPAKSMSADVAVARRAFRQIWIGATVWALVFGGTIAASALSYVNSFPDAASRRQLLRTTGGDTGLSILLGPISAIDTVGGYTVYKAFVFLTTIGAIWGLLTTTRLLRGEEDTGRWHLVLAGGTRPGRATLATIIALGAAVGIVFAGTTLITLARRPGRGRGLRCECDGAVRREPRDRTGGVRRRRRTHLTAGALAPGRHGPGHARVRRRVRRAHDRGLRPQHAVAPLAHAVRMDRAHAAVHRQRLATARRSPARAWSRS